MEALLPSETSQARLSSSAAQCPYLPSSHNRTLKSSSVYATAFLAQSSKALPQSLKQHHDQKQLEEERAYFILQGTVHHPGKPGQKLKAGTDEEATEECRLFACSSWLT